jgi:aryl-alcohol dehydrogenase-like predicted oxidoreductase
VQLAALEDMRHEGKFDLIGLSNVGQEKLQVALEFVNVAGIHNGYSVLDPQDDDLVEFAREREITFVPFFPLGSAFRGRAGSTRGRPVDRPGCRQTRGHADPNRAGVVASSLGPDAADPGH